MREILITFRTKRKPKKCYGVKESEFKLHGRYDRRNAKNACITFHPTLAAFAYMHVFTNSYFCFLFNLDEDVQ